MRNLDECKTEIFRRSDERIKEKKKRQKQIVGFCIPLMLFAAMWSVFILPAMMPAKSENSAAYDGITTGTPENSYGNTLAALQNTSGSTTTAAGQDEQKVTQASVQTSGSYPYILAAVFSGASEEGECIDDKIQVAEIYETVCNIFTHSETKSESAPEEPDDTQSDSSSVMTYGENYKEFADDALLSWKIVFYAENGSQEAYTLKENRLEKESDGRVIIISPEQLEALSAVLCLPED